MRIAEEVIAEHGCHALSIDKLASRFEYSRSTVYLHFDNKADVLCAVATAVLDRQFGACELILPEARNARERVLTVALVHAESVKRHPHVIMVNLMLYDRRMIEQANERRRAALYAQRSRAYAVAETLVHEATGAGHLKTDAPASVLLPVWSMMLGGSAVLADPQGIWRERLASPDQAVFDGANALLDGLGWGPLSNTCNCEQARADIQMRIDERIPAECWNHGPAGANN
ncbi:MAG: hypothetical protein DHS20C14_05830 [Phycisphaeraceae bacterium]|nr:MAG: hypothetical protein DHS20C14_05830 [Phycisphaeraceae bacterium]